MFSIRSQVKKKALNYFFLNEGSKVYINELARIIQVDPKNTYRMLISLENEGILISEFQGKQRYFYANTRHPFYKEYKTVFLKTIGVENLLKESLQKIKGLTGAYLFGSYAQDKYGPASDIDVLLVGKHRSLEAQKAIYKIQKDSNREINVINMRPADFKKKREQGDQFMKTIFSRKIIKLI